MPAHAFLMSGAAEPLVLAGSCPVTAGPHCADPGSFLVADAAVRDGSAAVRLALWRCKFCRSLLVGVGPQSGVLDVSGDRALIDSQEFTWLEQPVALLGEKGMTE